MKPRAAAPIALAILTGMALAGKFLPEAGSIPASAQEPAAGAPIPARSPLFEALERRATDDAARRRAGARSVDAARSVGAARTVETWDRKRAFAEMERLRAEIVMLGGLHGAQRELLLWNRERIKSGGSPAVLPARLCRAAALGAWCPMLPATFGAAVRRPGKTAARSMSRSAPSAALNAALNDSGPAEERMPPNQPGNGPTEDELP